MAFYGIRDAASSHVNPVILAQKMYFQAHHYAGPWGAVTGDNAFTTPQGAMIVPNGAIKAGEVSNSPVVLHRELQTQQGLEVRVPLLRNINDMPKKGRENLKGTGKTQNINWADVFIDVMRQAVKIKDGPIGEQVTKDLMLKSKANGQLKTHYGRCMAYLQYSWAMYNRYAYHVLNSDTYDNNANVARVSHPHIYTVGGGKVSYGTVDYPGNANYETAVATAIEAVTAANVLTPGKLVDLAFEEQIRKIRPLMTHDGMPYKIMFLAPLVFKEFKQQFVNGKHKDSVDLSYLRSKNPVISNCQMFLEGFAIFDGGFSVYPCSGYSATPVFGPHVAATGVQSITDLTSFESHDSGKYANIILGDNGMFKATGSPLQFTTEEDDHGFWEELGYTVMEGTSRGDFMNRDDGSYTGQYLQNDGSALVISYGAKGTV